MLAAVGLTASLITAPASAHSTPSTSATTTPPVPAATSTGTSDPVGIARQEAKKSNKRVEIPERNTETTTLYANPDGKTLRMELYLEPIRVKNANGDGLTPIDTTLVEADGVIKPKAAKGSLTLSPGGNTEAIKSKSGDIAAQIDAPHTLPKPTLNGSTATYASTYGKGIDLVVTATPTGFRQQIVIRQRPTGPVTFRVPVDLPKGISFGKNAKGQPTLKSADGKHSLDLRPAALLDAAAADANADLGAVRVGRAQVNLDSSALVYSPDPAFLADPATTFPVTMAAVNDDWWECTLGNCPDGVGDPMDTYINDVDLTDSWDMHARDQMWVGKSYASSIAKRWRAYIQFPLPRSSDPFWGSRIQNADLELWNYLSNDCGLFVGSGITARRITSDWDHLTLQWGDQPSVTNVGADTEYGAYSPDCSGSMNYEHDLIHYVNPIVQEWADGEPNYGFQLTAGDESELRNWRRYRTREQTSGYPAHGPRLTVDFEPPAKPRLGVVMLEEGESSPKTYGELDQLIADGRVTNTLPEPDPITFEQAQEYRDNSDQDYTVPHEELEVPLPAPEADVAAHWSFDEGSGTTAADSSGNEHHATVNSGISWTPGIGTSALTNVGVSTSGVAGPVAQNALPGRVTASRKAAADKVRVEVNEETTETSVTYAEPDGKSFTTEITTGPVRTQRNGRWIPIDTSLIEQGGALKAKALAAGASVEVSTGGTGAFVTMTTAEGQRYALRWPTELPKPTVAKNVVTFADAAGRGADLVVTVLPTGFRHDVMLRERPAKPLELRIGVEAGDLTLSEGKGGRLLLTGKDEKLVASAPQPIMWDGSAKGRLPLAKHAVIDTQVVSKTGRTELVLKPDHAFLSDPKTVYPVRVDPTTTLPVNNDLTVFTTDTASSPAYPSSNAMFVGVQNGQKGRALLRFDTSSLVGKTVTDAKLSMSIIDANTCGAAVGQGVQAARVTGAWDENNLYWANKPAFTTEDAQINKASIDCTGAQTPTEWNITGISQDWAAGAANHGLVLKAPTENTVIENRHYASSEGTEWNAPPKIVVTTSAPASSPTIANLTITPAQDVAGTIVTTSLTPQLAATVADTVGGNLTGEFEVEHDPATTGQGTGQIWTGSSTAVASGNPATVTLPAGKLADGWKIRWRVRAANATAGTASAWSDWQTATVDVPNPTVGLFQVTPSQLVDGQTVTTSLTPTLHTTVTDPAAQPVRAEFEVEHDPAATGQGSGQIWAGAVDNVASGAQASLTVPAGKLNDGWRIRWRARASNTATSISSPWSEWQSLTIDVPDPGSEPAVTALQITPSSQVEGKTVTDTLTPTLLAQVIDPVGGSLRGEFEVEHDPAAPGQGTGQIWAGGSDNVPAGTQASIAIPGDKLTDGWLVRWRARAVSTTAASAWSDWQHFTVDVPNATVTNISITPSVVIDGTVTTTLTPTLKATFTHPSDQPMRGEFEVEHDPAAPGQGTGQIWTGALEDIASDTLGQIAIPSGKLVHGWKIRWRVRAEAAQHSSAWSMWKQATVKTTLLQGGPFAQTSGAVLPQARTSP
ncbi:DNRLRE domain-containing protein [Nonomuraea recticatena]|uniref:DNRLRE domain-containing protein n=1 Tax=Nonomuraea recticatena TaxID=46178 RepID=UPI003623CC5F